MNNRDWPLMAFTLIMQFSAGVVLLYDLFLLYPVALKQEKLPLRFQWILVIALAAAVAALLLSLIHLGSPRNAFRTLGNLSNSWLSREILMVIIFTGLLAVVTALQFRFPTGIRTYKLLLDLNALAGLLLIYVMSRIYMIPSMPAWNSIFTPLSFYLSMFLIASCFLLLFQLNRGSWASQKGLAILIVAVPVLQLGMLPIHMSWMGEAGEAARMSQSILLNEFLPAFYLRLGLEILTIGFGLWAFFSIRSDTVRSSNLIIPSILALATSVGAVVIDRFLFYRQIIPIGNL
jgi:anaerobic dimethyl sulfoxide reductase subunit C (anchor subunit)